MGCVWDCSETWHICSTTHQQTQEGALCLTQPCAWLSVIHEFSMPAIRAACGVPWKFGCTSLQPSANLTATPTAAAVQLPQAVPHMHIYHCHLTYRSCSCQPQQHQQRGPRAQPPAAVTPSQRHHFQRFCSGPRSNSHKSSIAPKAPHSWRTRGCCLHGDCCQKPR